MPRQQTTPERRRFFRTATALLATPITASASASLSAALLAAAAAPRNAHANGQTARILVGFSPGGSFDLIARLLADKLRSELGRPVIVENRPGAGGMLAVENLRRSPADGSVMMLGPDALVAMYPYTMRKINYNPQTDMLPVGTVTEFPFVLCVGADSSVQNFAQFVETAKAAKDGMHFGVPARGAPHHFFGLALGQATGAKMEDVPFQGSTPMLQALMGNQIPAAIDAMGSVLESYRSKKVRALAVSSPQRMPQMPDVPTFAELGYTQITGLGFNALYAPPGTAATVIQTWAQALQKALADPALRQRLADLGMQAVAQPNPQELATCGQQAAARWEPIIKASGFVAN